MASWQELYEMLLEETLTPQEIVAKLHVRPSRLRRMLASKRLAARLALAESIAKKRGDHAVAGRVGAAAGRLAALVDSERPETARRACLDVMASARQLRQQPEPVPWLPLWNRKSREKDSRREPPVWPARRPAGGVAAGPSAPAAPTAPTKPGSRQPQATETPGRSARGDQHGQAGPAQEGTTPAEPNALATKSFGPPAESHANARRSGPSLESMLAEARRKRQFREEIIRHGGVRIARRRQLGR